MLTKDQIKRFDRLGAREQSRAAYKLAEIIADHVKKRHDSGLGHPKTLASAGRALEGARRTVYQSEDTGNALGSIEFSADAVWYAYATFDPIMNEVFIPDNTQQQEAERVLQDSLTQAGI